MQIFLGRLNTLVSQQILHGPDIYAILPRKKAAPHAAPVNRV
ncbi:hypothetical protein RAHE111665_16300 [Rariglobus hedericola]